MSRGLGTEWFVFSFSRSMVSFDYPHALRRGSSIITVARVAPTVPTGETAINRLVAGGERHVLTHVVGVHGSGGGGGEIGSLPSTIAYLGVL